MARTFLIAIEVCFGVKAIDEIEALEKGELQAKNVETQLTSMKPVSVELADTMEITNPSLIKKLS